MIVLFFVACGEAGPGSEFSSDEDQSGDSPADSDAPLSDGDLDDGEGEPIDGEQEAATVCRTIDDCPEGYTCNPYTFVCIPTVECDDDGECQTSHGPAYVCADGTCQPTACTANGDCPDGHYCTGGLCAPQPDCSGIADMFIERVLPYLKIGQEMQLVAHAVDASGALIPSVAFRWRSLDSGVVSIDPSTGLARGGLRSGTTTILVEPHFALEICEGLGLSASVSLQNFALQLSGARVIVIDQSTGETVSGATVMINDLSAVTPTEANRGVATFQDAEPPFDIHVFHPNYHYRSLLKIGARDVLIPLRRFTGLNRKAGVRGELDFSRIPAVLEQDSRFGMAGLSVVGSLLDLGVTELFASPLMTVIPFDGPFHDELPMPSNVEIVLGDDSPQREVLAEGDIRSTTAWAMGGFIAADDLMEQVVARLYAGWIDVGAFLISSLAYSGTFYHAVLEGVSLDAQPMVPDDGTGAQPPYDEADLNGNGQTNDLVPDYSGFTPLPGPLVLERALDRRVKVTAGKLPSIFSGLPDGVFALVGARTPNGQFVPLGVGAKALDETNPDKPNPEEGGELWVNFAPLYGGLYDRYILIAYAVPFSNLFGFDDGPAPYSAIVRYSENAPSEANVGDFLPFVLWAQVFEAERRLSLLGNEQGDIYRAVFHNQQRDWEVLVGADGSILSYVDMILPTPPDDDPFGPSVDVETVELSRGVSLDSLAEFNNLPLTKLDEAVERFSVYRLSSESRLGLSTGR
ncbi:MAG: hypothetical protein C4523_16910 [Myxococcales bacterium]|nr:MAG: hypothetical protein C4523_16910 [Myxococcales bacterium]